MGWSPAWLLILASAAVNVASRTKNSTTRKMAFSEYAFGMCSASHCQPWTEWNTRSRQNQLDAHRTMPNNSSQRQNAVWHGRKIDAASVRKKMKCDAGKNNATTSMPANGKNARGNSMVSNKLAHSQRADAASEKFAQQTHKLPHSGRKLLAGQRNVTARVGNWLKSNSSLSLALLATAACPMNAMRRTKKCEAFSIGRGTSIYQWVRLTLDLLLGRTRIGYGDVLAANIS